MTPPCSLNPQLQSSKIDLTVGLFGTNSSVSDHGIKNPLSTTVKA